MVLIFDGDTAGLEAADRALEVCLSQRIDTKLASVPEGKDPCDFILAAGKERFEQLVDTAVDVFQFKWNRLIENFGSDETLIIIVSDHGQSDGKHTHYGFYSINKPLNINNPKLVDFYQIIMDYLEKKPYTEEEEKILANRLRKLGYVS